MELLWSPQALEDLQSIRSYISADNPDAARTVVLAIIDVIEQQLPRMPHSGRRGRVAGTRELVLQKLPFVVPYRVTNSKIEILRVYHTSRRWPDQM